MKMCIGNPKIKKKKIANMFIVGFDTFLVLVAILNPVHVISENATTENFVLRGINILKDSINGWGIHVVIIVLGIGSLFCAVKESDKHEGNNAIKAISGLFAICTVFGKSFMEMGNWNYIFYDISQMLWSFCMGVGYYILYKYSILFVSYRIGQKHKLFRKQTYGQIENWIFSIHPFLGPLLFIFCFAIPWLICFFPGTIEPDALHQLLMSHGLAQMTGHHPVLVTKIMGKCLYIGHTLGSDNLGIFLYTFGQFATQSLVMAYSIYVINRLEIPVPFRWGILLFYSVYPIFPLWGYTMVKDTGYYIFTLLFITVIIHLFAAGKEDMERWCIFLFLGSGLGMCIFRKEGCIVVAVTSFFGMVAFKKYRKLFLCGVVTSILSVILISGIYMKAEGIPQGPIKEGMSIPLQQTARYVKDHFEEITPEEAAVLQRVFTADLNEMKSLYNPDIADPVKTSFLSYPTVEEVKDYLNIWFQQMLKHPETYVQAFLHHVYGYFYPDKYDPTQETIGVFDLVSHEGINIAFGIKNNFCRELLEEYAKLTRQIPVLCMFYGPGTYVWILMGCIIFSWSKNRKKELFFFIPSCCILFFCLMSPVDACLRYTLPIVISLPVQIAWLYSQQTLQQAPWSATRYRSGGSLEDETHED